MESVSVSSGVGANTDQPYVQILIEAADWMTQMPPETAREIAMNLLSAADAAESDYFLVSFVRDIIGVDELDAAVGVLEEFRQYRARRVEEQSDDGE